MPRLHTPLCDLFGIRLPIIQAPMASAVSPTLVKVVSAAGALGSLGHAYTQPERMLTDAAEVRAHTDRPFQLNFFVAPQPAPVAQAEQGAALRAVAPYYAELGLPAPDFVQPPFAPDLAAQLAAAREIRPAALSMHLADLPRATIREFQALGVKVGGSATCVAEGRQLEELGLDFIIAQGADAGGHRGTWMRDPYACMTGTLSLTRMLVRALRTPVVAAGGIMDGAGIAAALALGAQGVQMGTAFIPCPEASAPEVHKQALLAQRDDNSVITEKFTGKPARGIANRYMREAKSNPQLPFPIQGGLTGKLRTAAAQAGNPEFYALWCGQAAPLARALPAAQLLATLETETLEALDRLAGLRQ